LEDGQNLGLLSPDSCLVIQCCHPRGETNLSLIDLATGERLQLTNTPDRLNFNPQWWEGNPELIVIVSTMVDPSDQPRPGHVNPLLNLGDFPPPELIYSIADFFPRAAHPKTSNPATTKTITNGATRSDVLDCGSASGVAVALESVGGNPGLDVGATGVCVLVGTALGRAGIGVVVAGGVTRRSSFCPGWRIEAEVSPFQAINSARLISYRSAIQARNSPLLMM
jgi:hypothetical protein